MTERPARDADRRPRRRWRRGRRRAPQRKTAPIVPAQNIAGRALVLVIAIMTFLSCLTLGAVTLVRDTASVWENQISREATIQIKPADGLDMEAALDTSRAASPRGFAGVRRRTDRRPRSDRAAAGAVARRGARTSTNCRCRAWSSSPSTRTTRPISPRCAPCSRRKCRAPRSTITAPGSTAWSPWPAPR